MIKDYDAFRASVKDELDTANRGRIKIRVGGRQDGSWKIIALKYLLGLFPLKGKIDFSDHHFDLAIQR